MDQLTGTLDGTDRMKNLEKTIDHPKSVEDGFYGRIHIRIRAGKAVMITEERDTRLDDDAEMDEVRDAHIN